jgi:hypothetical protein
MKTPEQYAKLAELLTANTPVCEALALAGWSKTQALKGWKKVPPVVMAMLPKPMQKLIDLGKKTSPDDRRNLVLGRLVENVTSGTDKGAMSAKILGSDRELNMWQPDQLAGVVILGTMPQSVQTPKEDLLKLPRDLGE